MCLLHSLAHADLTLQLLSNGATWYLFAGMRTCTHEQKFCLVYYSSVWSSDVNKTTQKIKRRSIFNVKISGSTVLQEMIILASFPLPAFDRFQCANSAGIKFHVSNVNVHKLGGHRRGGGGGGGGHDRKNAFRPCSEQ